MGFGRRLWMYFVFACLVVAIGALAVYFGPRTLSHFGLDSPAIGIDGSSANPPSAADAASGPSYATASVRRLNEQQYIRSVHDIFGPDITVPGRFEPPVREEGLLAIGESRATVSSAGFEQDELRAREIASQVLAEPVRQSSVPCQPADEAGFDRGCAEQFLAKYGRLLYRRPLSEAEMTLSVGIAESVTAKSGNFYKGLEAALSRLLVSPYFIFRVEDYEPDPKHAERWRLTDYSLASRISFLLWDATPDTAMLDAAASGALRTRRGLRKQVNRLISSPRFEDGVRAFFSDMFGYEQFDSVSKDQAIFPIYTSQLAKDAKEQALRTIVQLLVTDKDDYRDLFTTKKTFMNRRLGGLYNVPISASAVDGWAPFTFRDEDNRAGILTLAAFLMLDLTHEGRTSPTIRGKSIRELLLCQPVPSPPGNVDFSLVQDVNNPLYKTVRQRLTAHRKEPTCAGCHALTDPLGLSLENYDAVGQYRARENGAVIDASGSFEGKPYNNAVELEQLIRDGSTATDCVVRRVYEYGVGHPVSENEYNAVDKLTQRFARAGYTFPALMREVAMSEAFQSKPATTLASN